MRGGTGEDQRGVVHDVARHRALVGQAVAELQRPGGDGRCAGVGVGGGHDQLAAAELGQAHVRGKSEVLLAVSVSLATTSRPSDEPDLNTTLLRPRRVLMFAGVQPLGASVVLAWTARTVPLATLTESAAEDVGEARGGARLQDAEVDVGRSAIGVAAGKENAAGPGHGQAAAAAAADVARQHEARARGRAKGRRARCGTVDRDVAGQGNGEILSTPLLTVVVPVHVLPPERIAVPPLTARLPEPLMLPLIVEEGPAKTRAALLTMLPATEPLFVPSPNCSVPAEMVVVPVYVLEAVSVNWPLPSLARPIPAATLKGLLAVSVSPCKHRGPATSRS